MLFPCYISILTLGIVVRIDGVAWEDAMNANRYRPTSLLHWSARRRSGSKLDFEKDAPAEPRCGTPQEEAMRCKRWLEMFLAAGDATAGSAGDTGCLWSYISDTVFGVL